MADTWHKLKEWPEVYLERLTDAGVARVVLNRPAKRNALTEALVASFHEALEIIRAEPGLKVVITKGAGPSWSAGLDLRDLRGLEQNAAQRDWDRPTGHTRLIESFRDFPRITIAQVHGYCLGGSMAFMNVHDLVFAAEDAQIGMPEVPRGSFGQNATSTLFRHANIPIKKAAFIALTARNVSGVEADRLGLVSLCAPAKDLEATTNGIAREIASRHLTPLQHHKIAAHMGRDLTFIEAVKLDNLLGVRQAGGIDATGSVDEWLESQKGGPNRNYKRPDKT